jgi:hypothetical protein
MNDPILCDWCGEVLEEGYFSPGEHSPERHLRFCTPNERDAAFRQSHPDATPEEIFTEKCADLFHRIHPDTPPSRDWTA